MTSTTMADGCSVRLQLANELSKNRSLELRMHHVFEQQNILGIVLSHIRQPKAKIRLERVCRLFRLVVRSPEAWIQNDSLVFLDQIENDASNGTVLVNGESFRIEDLPDILATLLRRMKLRELRLGFCNTEMVYEMVLARLCSAEIMPAVHTLTLTGRGKDTNVLPFIWAFQTTLRSLHVGNCVFASRVRVVEFWKAVKACKHLEEFRHLSYRSHIDTISLEDDVVDALKGKKLSTLYLLALRNLSPTGITDLLRSIPPGCLRKLSLSHGNVSLRTIRDQVDDAHRFGLREFRFGPFPADGTDDQLAVAIPLIFPNLRRCTLEAQALTFPSTTVVETIDRFLTHLESSSTEQPKSPKKFTATDKSAVILCMSIYYQHIEVLEKVLGRMVREKCCSVTPVKYSHVRDGYIIERNGAKLVFYDFELLESD